jgi:ABC-type nitrate/sulfonate/bicarbonate transport system substrate-binding protein
MASTNKETRMNVHDNDNETRTPARRASRTAATAMLAALFLVGCAGTAATPPPATPAPATATAAPATATAAPATPAPTAAPATATAAPATPTAAPATPTAAPATPTAAPTAATVTLPAPEKTTIKIATSALEANTFVAWYAMDAGLYKKHGLDVEVSFFEGAQTEQSLLSGQVDAIRGSLESAFFSQRTNAPAIVVAAFYNKFLDDFITAGNIKTAADLKGKKVGTSTFGGLSHRETLVALRELGLTGDDVEIIQIGGQSARIAALQAGSVAGIVADSSRRADMEKNGFNIMVKLNELDTKTTNGALIVTKKFADENPNTVLAIVAANLDAMQLMFEDTPKAVEALARWAQVEQSEADATLRQFLSVAQRDLTFTREGNVEFQEFLKLQDATIGDINVDDTYTLKFLDQLKQMGYYQQAGVPGY